MTSMKSKLLIQLSREFIHSPKDLFYIILEYALEDPAEVVHQKYKDTFHHVWKCQDCQQEIPFTSNYFQDNFWHYCPTHGKKIWKDMTLPGFYFKTNCKRCNSKNNTYITDQQNDFIACLNCSKFNWCEYSNQYEICEVYHLDCCQKFDCKHHTCCIYTR